MPKQKTHKGAAKRFKITAKGKVMRGHANTSHMFTSKTTKRKRHLRKQTTVSPAFAKQIREMIQT
jgi:large subunit ribosomal protein L35